MTDHDHETALRAATGELGPEALARWQARLSADAGLRADAERVLEQAALLRGTRAEGFSLGFAARVQRRVQAERGAPDLFAAVLLARHFRRLAPLALTAMLLLSGYVLRAGRTSGQSPLEALVGLPPVNADALLAPDSASPLD